MSEGSAAPGRPPGVDGRKVFFIHVMKTGGTTLMYHLAEHFGRDAVYPTKPDRQGRNPYLDIGYLLSLPPERIEATAAFCGHLPFVVTELLPFDPIRWTILRHPVARTASYLKHARRTIPRVADASLEEIYEDGFLNPFFVQDHQTKVFSMTRDDPLDTIMDVIDVDEARLALAQANLERVDVVGLQERFEDFQAEIDRRYGIPAYDVDDKRVSSESLEISDELRRRIERDNSIDVAFYDFAVELVERRRRDDRRRVHPLG